MKFVVGTMIEDDVIALKGKNAGIYETNMDFDSEDYEILGFEGGHIVFETPDTLGLVDEIKQSFDTNDKIYTKCLFKEGGDFKARNVDEVTLSDGKTVREKIIGI